MGETSASMHARRKCRIGHSATRRRMRVGVGWAPRACMIENSRAMTHASPRVGSPGKNLPIDGLRTVAILMVMLFHCGAPWSQAGWLGVDLFFVISGFLITTLLLDERARVARISLPLFWARRFLRLMPIYMLYVGGITLAMCLGPSEALAEHGGWTSKEYIVSLWTYWSNFFPQGGLWTHQYLTRHLWSLAVEEQFYIAWPTLLVIAARLGLAEPFAWLLVAIMSVSNAANYEGHPPGYLLHTRGIGLLVGCATATTLHLRRAYLRRLRIVSKPAQLISMAVVCTCYLTITFVARRQGVSESAFLPVGVPVFVFAAASLIANLWELPDVGAGSWLVTRPLPQLGAVSYGAYLYHMFVWQMVWVHLLQGIEHWPSVPKFGLRLFTYVGLTFLAASLSYRYVETPFLRLKRRLAAHTPEPATDRVIAQPAQP